MFFNKKKELAEQKRLESMQQEQLESKRQEQFNNIIKEATKIVNTESDEEIHPIFTFIKQFTDLITAETAIHSYNYNKYNPAFTLSAIFKGVKSTHSNDKIKSIRFQKPHPDDLKYYQKTGDYYSSQPISVDFLNYPIVLNPWKHERITSNILNISTKANEFDYENNKNNIKNEYYFPIGAVVCQGGNHSQYSTKLKGSGITKIESAIDISKLYDYITFDGLQFTYTFPEEEPYTDTISLNDNLSFYGGVLYEIGRLLNGNRKLFPQEITNAITSSKPL